MTLTDKLDKIYAESLEADLSNATREELISDMESIALVCDEFLTQPYYELSGEHTMKLSKLRKLCLDSIDELKHGVDALLHWTLQRDLMLSLGSEIRQNLHFAACGGALRI